MAVVGDRGDGTKTPLGHERHKWRTTVQSLVQFIRMSPVRKELCSVEQVRQHVTQHGSLFRTVLQAVDLYQETDFICGVSASDAIFLGCRLQERAIAHIQTSGGMTFPDLGGLPYKAFRSAFYSSEELLTGFQPSKKGYLLA